ncbi:response regulator transcription factor [Kineococcus rhizosphaerae]|uniref:Regulatory LuxR family protein n=1 Tax=Kineococcus rhizosphaerae TaxID=559628 RepID=A0A2T0R6Y4_9ACTN|nr:LuxR C-terminal-related transcriptional regulator [Kineococcus rhizosphaerae]PRY16871.1 regulatory LuxR family protein [Kineococcus rhizosphaerae]
MRADGTVDLAAELWPHLLDAIASGEHRMVLESASGGRVVLISEREVQRLEEQARAGRPASRTILTARETEILLLVEAGLNGAQIATRLGLSTNTVAQHLSSARRKYGLRSSAAAATAARQAGHLPDANRGESTS